MGSCVSSQQTVSKKSRRVSSKQNPDCVQAMKNRVMLEKIRNCPKLTLETNFLYKQRKSTKPEKSVNSEVSRPTSRCSC
jgi:hypothetical protein